MLVLTRRIGKSVVISVPPSDCKQLITVTLCDMQPEQARLGFNAPKLVEILREELIAESPEDLDGI